MHSHFAITIPDDAWETNDALDDPTDRLHVTLTVNGHDLHLEAWKVTERDGWQTHDTGPEDYDNLHAAVSADGHFQTIAIHGTPYIILASPYC
jgi:hypothetical protein